MTYLIFIAIGFAGICLATDNVLQGKRIKKLENQIKNINEQLNSKNE